MNTVVRVSRNYFQNTKKCNNAKYIWNNRKLSTEPTNKSESAPESIESLEKKRGGYAKAFDKFEAQIKKDNAPQNLTFSALLRNSKFIDLGDPCGKIVQGKIFKIIDDDLYIDFGWKFHCVCPKPKNKAGNYVRGSKVRLLIKDLELSSKFLGYEKDITLLEADAILLGPVQDRSSSTLATTSS